MSRDMWDDGGAGPGPEAIEARAKAVWVTPTLKLANVALKTEVKGAANSEVNSVSIKNGS